MQCKMLILLYRALTLLNCCLVYQTIPELKMQMKHFFAFSTQLLMLHVSYDLRMLLVVQENCKSSFEVFVADSIFLGYVSLVNQFSVLQGNIVTPSSWTCRPLKMRQLHWLEISETDYLVTQCGIPEEQNLEIENSLYQLKWWLLYEVSLAILSVLPSGFPSVHCFQIVCTDLICQTFPQFYRMRMPKIFTNNVIFKLFQKSYRYSSCISCGFVLLKPCCFSYCVNI